MTRETETPSPLRGGLGWGSRNGSSSSGLLRFVRNDESWACLHEFVICAGR
jgi:hypothetical protein